MVDVIDYSPTYIKEFGLETVEDIFPHRESPYNSWINFVGIHNAEEVAKVCDHYGIHPLTVEDILQQEQRPKLEDNPEYLFVTLSMLHFDETTMGVDVEQVSFVLGKSWLLTFQERNEDTFEPVRKRLRKQKGRIIKNKSDYLLYTLIDTIVDYYFVVLEKIGDELEDMEAEILVNPNQKLLDRLYFLKKELISVRRAIWPLREVVIKLERDDSLKLIQKGTRLFFRDVYDHVVQVIDAVESSRDLANSLVDLYQSMLGNRTNDVMRVLTVISTIFIPLTFMTGVYGMNFQHMPELAKPWAYPVLWASMLAMSGGLILYFRRKRWL
ncbi:MAG: magnesium/cobalt transporter CorA [Bacteroidota bacterium]